MTSRPDASGVEGNEKNSFADSASATPTDEMPVSKVGDVVQSQGVTRMEAADREAKANRKTFYLVGVSVLVCHNSMLSTLSHMSIIGAVSKPLIATISDITSRPCTYIFALIFYTVGYIVAATSQSVSAHIVGEVIVAVGGAGLDLTNDIIVADLTPIEWRGFAGSLLSTPFIINTWFAGKIVDAITPAAKPKETWKQALIENFHEIDAFWPHPA
ncbi:Uncharacterized protein TPAR_04240 [Tolypocladium paradoxum]|uniref:Uncharacterized protein n=1 Tax=Tolypocladium paradoxum TaxID=94208 RepID=A0A2S4KZI0_9HYPO|nr:Uncharacterized protein TPAR_04240 [Tolypocladium paradoxum]